MLNDACLHDPFSTTFTDEVLDNLGGQESYSLRRDFQDTIRLGLHLEINIRPHFLQNGAHINTQ